MGVASDSEGARLVVDTSSDNSEDVHMLSGNLNERRGEVRNNLDHRGPYSSFTGSFADAGSSFQTGCSLIYGDGNVRNIANSRTDIATIFGSNQPMAGTYRDGAIRAGSNLSMPKSRREDGIFGSHPPMAESRKEGASIFGSYRPMAESPRDDKTICGLYRPMAESQGDDKSIFDPYRPMVESQRDDKTNFGPYRPIAETRRESGRIFGSDRPSVIVPSPEAVLELFPPQVLRPPNGITCRILTQPRPLMRFRYWSEYKDNRAAHKIVGQDSTSDGTTYPSIWIEGWTGAAKIVVCLVQAEKSTELHPHSLCGSTQTPACEKQMLKMLQQGYVERRVMCGASGTLVKLDNLCLIRNRKGQMSQLLQERYRRLNPSGTQPKDARHINAHAVRLCIHVQLEGVPFHLPPAISDVIRNSGAHQTLKIFKLGFCAPHADSTQEVMVLCDKVDKDDIEVELVSLERGAENLLRRTSPNEVYGQVMLVFALPVKFLAGNHQHTFVRLRRPSTADVSELFRFWPPESVSEPATGGTSSPSERHYRWTSPAAGPCAASAAPGAPAAPAAPTRARPRAPAPARPTDRDGPVVVLDDTEDSEDEEPQLCTLSPSELETIRVIMEVDNLSGLINSVTMEPEPPDLHMDNIATLSNKK